MSDDDTLHDALKLTVEPQVLARLEKQALDNGQTLRGFVGDLLRDWWVKEITAGLSLVEALIVLEAIDPKEGETHDDEIHGN